MKSETIEKMSSFPDDLLLQIMSSLSINEVVATSVLSKRWCFLWKRVTKLNYDDRSCNLSRLRQFVSKYLPFGSGGVVESFHLKLNNRLSKPALAEYIDLLARLYVREVRIDSVYASYKLPRRLDDRFWTLETLILQKLSLVDVPCSKLRFRLRFLKTLHLLSVKFSDDEYVQRLLRSCPVLEDLVVRRTTYVNVMMFTINVPTLRSLSIDYLWAVSQPVGVHGFVINTPSLRYLNIKDSFSNALWFGHMPELVKENVEVACDQPENILGSLTSIHYLSLCSKTSKILYPTRTLFFFLQNVELCTCSPVWWNLLNYILQDSPRLQVLKLKLKLKHCVRFTTDPMDRWNQPCSVPECLLSHLEIFEWRHYKGTKQEKKVAKYILANATCLKMATFSSVSAKKKRIFNKLEFAARVSEACQLVFE